MYIYSKERWFIDIFTYCNVRKLTAFSIQVYPIRCLGLPFLLITVALLKGSKGGVDLPLKINVNNLINEITPVGARYFLLWYVIVQLYDLERSFFMLQFQSFRVFWFSSSSGRGNLRRILRSRGSRGSKSPKDFK